MMNFKSHSGFLLMEAVLALFVAALILGPLFTTQGNILQHLSNAVAHVDRFFVAKYFLLSSIEENRQSKERHTKIDKKEEEPATTMMYEESALDKKSVFAEFQGITLARVTFGWELLGKGKSDSITVLVFLLPVQKEKQ